MRGRALLLLALTPMALHAQWRIDPQPVVDIGSAAAAEEYLFKTPVASRAPGGAIVIADRDYVDVRVFDTNGAFVRRLGRKGQGPGEYRRPHWVSVGRGDTVTVYDYGEGRSGVLRYTSSGAIVDGASVRAGPTLFSPQPLRVLPDGSMLLWGTDGTTYPPDKPQPFRGLASVARFTRPESISVLSSHPGQVAERVRYPWSRDGRRAANDSLIFSGDEETTTVNAYALDGKLRRTAKLPWVLREVGDAEKRAWLKRMQEQMQIDPQFKADLERQIERTTYPKNLPASSVWLTDRPGNLWVGEYTTAIWNRGPLEFVVFDASLRQVARISMPPRFTPQEIGADYILGKWLDEDDVPHIRMYRLRK